MADGKLPPIVKRPPPAVMKVAQILSLVNRCTHRLVHNKALGCWTVESFDSLAGIWRPGFVVPALAGFEASVGLTMYPTNADLTFYYAAEAAALAVLRGADALDEESLPMPLRYTLSLARARGLVEVDDRQMLRLSAEGRAAVAGVRAGAL